MPLPHAYARPARCPSQRTWRRGKVLHGASGGDERLQQQMEEAESALREAQAAVKMQAAIRGKSARASLRMSLATLCATPMTPHGPPHHAPATPTACGHGVRARSPARGRHSYGWMDSARHATV
eukprot:6641433-Prymnesium_polylepis.1